MENSSEPSHPITNVFSDAAQVKISKAAPPSLRHLPFVRKVVNEAHNELINHLTDHQGSVQGCSKRGTYVA